ncbi:hypothetical protein D3C87_1912080 [compost metagenome]
MERQCIEAISDQEGERRGEWKVCESGDDDTASWRHEKWEEPKRHNHQCNSDTEKAIRLFGRRHGCTDCDEHTSKKKES